jgi:hypothetical protein
VELASGASEVEREWLARLLANGLRLTQALRVARSAMLE